MIHAEGREADCAVTQSIEHEFGETVIAARFGDEQGIIGPMIDVEDFQKEPESPEYMSGPMMSTAGVSARQRPTNFCTGPPLGYRMPGKSICRWGSWAAG